MPGPILPIAGATAGGVGLGALAGSAALFLGSAAVQNFIQNRIISRQQGHLVRGAERADARSAQAHQAFRDTLRQYEQEERLRAFAGQQEQYQRRQRANQAAALGINSIAPQPTGSSPYAQATAKAEAASQARADTRGGYYGTMNAQRRMTEAEQNQLSRTLVEMARQASHAQGDRRVAEARAAAERGSFLEQLLGAAAAGGQIYGGYKTGQNFARAFL